MQYSVAEVPCVACAANRQSSIFKTKRTLRKKPKKAKLGPDAGSYDLPSSFDAAARPGLGTMRSTTTRDMFGSSGVKPGGEDAGAQVEDGAWSLCRGGLGGGGIAHHSAPLAEPSPYILMAAAGKMLPKPRCVIGVGRAVVQACSARDSKLVRSPV